MTTFNPIQLEAPKLAKRQPDIKVPLFQLPYTISNAAVSGRSFPANSFFPFMRTFGTRSQYFDTAEYEFYGPVQKGTTDINPGIAQGASSIFTIEGAYGFTGIQVSGLFGNNAWLGLKFPGSPNSNFSLPASLFQALDVSLAAVGNSNPGLWTGNWIQAGFYATNSFSQLVKDVYMTWNMQSTAGISKYVFPMIPYNSSLMPILGREWDFANGYDDSLVPGAVGSWQIRAGIVDPTLNGQTFVCITPPASQIPFLVTGKLILSTRDGSGNFLFASFVQFDSAAIQAKFTVPPTVTATPYGFLIKLPTTNFFAGQHDDLMLLSPDGTKYAMIALLPQTAAAQDTVSVGSGNMPQIDTSGTFYYFDSRFTNSHVFSSFGINLSWLPVNLGSLPNPAFFIPQLCGCDPRSAMGIPDYSPLET